MKKIIYITIGLLLISINSQAKEQKKRYSSYIECIKDQTVKINTFRELYVATHGQYEINEIKRKFL
jgi:hypothetical protein